VVDQTIESTLELLEDFVENYLKPMADALAEADEQLARAGCAS